MAGRAVRKKDAESELHHPWCSFVAAPRGGCENCDRLYAGYPFQPGETAAEATARYFPAVEAGAAPVPARAAESELVMIKRGRPVIEATEEMVEAHIKVKDALDEIDILMRQHTVTLRRTRKAEEIDRVNSARATQIKATRRRTDYIILETDGHRREVKRVKTTASKMEKDGKLPRELAHQLYAFAQRVADGMGAATEDEHDASNCLTSPYEPVATLGGYGSRTPSDRQLAGLAALQEMKNRIPPELIPIFTQLVDEEVAGYSPLRQTLAELGERLGYKHKQTSSAGGALVYAVTCLIAHYMRGRGFSADEVRQAAPNDAFFGENGYHPVPCPDLRLR